MRRLVLLVAASCLVLWSVTATTVYEVYRVQPSDTVETIASRFGMSPEELRALNPHLQTSTLTPNELLTVMIRGGSDQMPASGAVSRAATAQSRTAGGENAGSNIRKPGGPKVVNAGDPQDSHAALAPPGGASNVEEVPNKPAVKAGELPAVQAPEAQPSQAERVFAGNGVVGLLGNVRTAGSSIYSQADKSATRRFQCAGNEQLVVTKQVGDWYAIGMSDGSTGWIETSAVELTSTELVPMGSGASAASQPAMTPSFLRGRKVIEEAYRYLGVRYVWGGNGFRGIDCSGLVQQCYKKVGVTLPRVSRDQFTVGTRVDPYKLQAGDRLYFASEGTQIDHTGMYIANGQFIHASGRHRQVTVSNLFDPRYWKIFVGAKR